MFRLNKLAINSVILRRNADGPAENAFSCCWNLSPGLAGLALTCLDTPRLRQSVFQNSGIGTVGAIYFLRLRATALALRGPPAISRF